MNETPNWYIGFDFSAGRFCATRKPQRAIPTEFKGVRSAYGGDRPVYALFGFPSKEEALAASAEKNELSVITIPDDVVVPGRIFAVYDRRTNKDYLVTECVDCHRPYIITYSEWRFFTTREGMELPKRCQLCRDERKRRKLLKENKSDG